MSESQVKVIDTTGGGDNFSVIVISDIFENMNLIKEEVLNPVIEHVIFQLSPYFLKFLDGL